MRDTAVTYTTRIAGGAGVACAARPARRPPRGAGTWRGRSGPGPGRPGVGRGGAAVSRRPHVMRAPSPPPARRTTLGTVSGQRLNVPPHRCEGHERLQRPAGCCARARRRRRPRRPTSSTCALFGRPRHSYTAALPSAAPISGQVLRRERIVLAGDTTSLLDPPPGCAFRTRGPHARPACAAERPALREATPGHLRARIRDDLHPPAPT
jgi:oligopeptide/dipeptide ABC transporter ATP-binding protein